MNDQWIRKVELFVLSDEQAIDLSEFRIIFEIRNADVESPNTATIRVFNLSKDTIASMQKVEFSTVVLNAGYETGNFGAIFKGTIKQYRIGRENAIDTYVDILAADGDIGYNQGVVNTTVAAGGTSEQAIKAIGGSMPNIAPPDLASSGILVTKYQVPNIRGQVLFGMARARLRNYASTLDASWSIQNDQVTMIDRKGYLPGEVVEINTGTGLIGMPRQTDQGIELQCLLNSRVRIGGLVRLINSEIIQLLAQNPNAAPVPYNQWAGFQQIAPLSIDDGLYRAYVVEHSGDSRGHNWYTHIICLAIDGSSNQVVAP